MISVYDFLDEVAVFTGSIETAGLLMYIMALVVILVFMKSSRSRFFFIALPVTVGAAAIGLIKSDIMYLLLVVNVIGIITQIRRL